MSGLVHPDPNVRNATQNSLCRAVNRRRGCCACRASNCRRRARFSRTRSSRERKALTNQPRKCRSDAIIAGMISEKSESSFAPSHSFCRCTTFWRGTTRKQQFARDKRKANVPRVRHARLCRSRTPTPMSPAVIAYRIAPVARRREGATPSKKPVARGPSFR